MKGHARFLVAILFFAYQVNAECKPWQDDATGFTCFGGSIADLEGIPKNVTKIIIFGMPVVNVTKALFERVSDNLEKLVCQLCSITDIDDNTFGEMKNLKNLLLNNNNLTKVKATLFENIVALQTIMLAENEIYDIDKDAFSKLTKLTVLGLQSNYLTTIKTKWFQDIVSLPILNIEDNEIDDIEECAFCEKNLTYVLLGNNSLTKLKAEWFGDSGFPKYFSLTMSDNELDNFDATLIDKLRNIAVLDVSGNNLDWSSIQNILLGLQNASTIAIIKNSRCNDGETLQEFAEKKGIKIVEKFRFCQPCYIVYEIFSVFLQISHSPVESYNLFNK